MKIRNSGRKTTLTELNTTQLMRPLRHGVIGIAIPGLVLMLVLQTGCTSIEDATSNNACVKGNFEQVTLCPGASAACATNPCNLLFQMPGGEGEHQVTSNNLDMGTFPAGQTVNLGAFWEGSHVIEVQGSDAPRAYFRVVNDR